MGLWSWQRRCGIPEKGAGRRRPGCLRCGLKVHNCAHRCLPLLGTGNPRTHQTFHLEVQGLFSDLDLHFFPDLDLLLFMLMELDACSGGRRDLNLVFCFFISICVYGQSRAEDMLVPSQDICSRFMIGFNFCILFSVPVMIFLSILPCPLSCLDLMCMARSMSFICSDATGGQELFWLGG